MQLQRPALSTVQGAAAHQAYPLTVRRFAMWVSPLYTFNAAAGTVCASVCGLLRGASWPADQLCDGSDATQRHLRLNLATGAAALLLAAVIAWTVHVCVRRPVSRYSPEDRRRAQLDRLRAAKGDFPLPFPNGWYHAAGAPLPAGHYYASSACVTGAALACRRP